MSAQRALLGAVRFYQRAISPTRPPRCKFVPTCSQYAVEAIETHGALRGGWLALVRLLKCAPWHRGGVDLVPEPPRTGTSRPAHSSKTAAPDSGRGPDLVVAAGDRSSGSRHPAGLRPGSPAGDLPC